MKTNKTRLEEIAFTMIPLVGPVLGRQLIAYCGSVEAVLTESKKRLKSIPGIGEETAMQIAQSRRLFDAAEAELSWMEKNDVQYVFFLDPEYPTRLNFIPDAPLILYTRGNLNLQPERSIGIIGTRKPTIYGKTVTEEILETIAPFDITVVSGLAYGIDITAHKTCVRLHIPTIGVMGSGMSNIYPASHLPVTEKMQQLGGIITEFTSDTGPDAVNFPMRNRVVAGLCDLLIVVESGEKGGSMITAALANDYNRDVAAVPGRKIDKSSAGCNYLIKTQQAHLVETGEDILDLMGWNKRTKHQTFQTDLFAEMTGEERKIYSLIVEDTEKDIDTLAFQSKTTPGELATILLSLECKGAIKSRPGKKFMAIG